MPVLEKILTSKKMLIVYDFKDTPEGNRDRNIFQRQITSKPFYGVQKTASVYLCLYSVINLDKVRKWANTTHADIVVFGDVETSVRDNKRVSKLYYKRLVQITEEVKTIARNLRIQLIEFEDNYDDPERTLRGWATKMSGITNRYEEIKQLIDKVSKKDSEDEFDMESLKLHVKKLNERFEKVKDMKLKLGKKKK